MVKHTQTNCWHEPTKWLSVFDNFVRLALKGLKLIRFLRFLQFLMLVNFISCNHWKNENEILWKLENKRAVIWLKHGVKSISENSLMS